MKIGIRELKGKAPQVVREVRESGQSVDITYHGEIVARLSPVEPPADPAERAAAWKYFDDVVRDIGTRSKRRVKAATWRRDL